MKKNLAWSLGSLVMLGASLVAGCSSNTPATPRAAIQAFVGPGTMRGVNDNSKCQLGSAMPWIALGADDTHPVSDGDQQGGVGIGVSCTVKPAGDGFDVVANAVVNGQGSVTVRGHFVGMANMPPVPQMNVAAVFQRGDTGLFKDDHCTVDFAANMNMGFAPGRVWGSITCDNAYFDSQMRTCRGIAEFRFENCTQS